MSEANWDPITLLLTPRLAATLIAARGCESFTTGIGSCIKPQSGKKIVAKDGADLACAPCVAWAAVHTYCADPDA